jgi:hypothetical protein
VIYLYAFTDHPEASLPVLLGLSDGYGGVLPPYSVVYQNVAAVVSALNTSHLPPAETNVLRHEAVVEALMADRTVLPARFGTFLKDYAALRSVIVLYYACLVTNLQRLCGRVEIGVQVLWDEGQVQSTDRPDASHPHQTPVNGRAYMLGKLKVEQRNSAWRQQAETLAAELHLPLARLAVENTQQVLATPRLLLRASYLISREQVTVFRQEIENLRPAYPKLRFLCTGPWPPYSFVTEMIPEAVARQAPQAGRFTPARRNQPSMPGLGDEE